MPALVAEMWPQSVQCEMFQAEGESAVQVVMWEGHVRMGQGREGVEGAVSMCGGQSVLQD